MATSQDLRAALEKGTDELKLETLRRIIISTLNGSPHVRLTHLTGGCLCTDGPYDAVHPGTSANTPHAHHPIRPPLEK